MLLGFRDWKLHGEGHMSVQDEEGRCYRTVEKSFIFVITWTLSPYFRAVARSIRPEAEGRWSLFLLFRWGGYG
jgi:hypothetical protein